MRFIEFVSLIRSDCHRYYGNASFVSLCKALLIPGFAYSFWMRACAFLASHQLLRYSLFPPAWLVLRHYSYKYGISISHHAKIASGFYIGHFGGISVHPRTIIGKNCNLSQDVTIGVMNRGNRQGTPIIGEDVFIGPGAKIIGQLVIGNRVAIGANCVVTKDVPDNAVVVGVPGRVISYQGSEGYVNRTDYKHQ